MVRSFVALGNQITHYGWPSVPIYTSNCATKLAHRFSVDYNEEPQTHIHVTVMTQIVILYCLLYVIPPPPPGCGAVKFALCFQLHKL